MPHVHFKVETDPDGIALVTWDAPGRSMNVIDLKVIEELSAIVATVATDAAIKGAVITSGKDAFCAGADLTMLEVFSRAPLPDPPPHAGEGREGAARGEEAAATLLFEESRKLSLL